MNVKPRPAGSRFQRIKRSPRMRERIRTRLDRDLNLPLARASILLILLSLIQITSTLPGKEVVIVRTSILVLWAIFLLHLLVQLWVAPDRHAAQQHQLAQRSVVVDGIDRDHHRQPALSGLGG